MQYLYNFAMSHPIILLIMFVWMCGTISIWNPISINKYYHRCEECKRDDDKLE